MTLAERELVFELSAGISGLLVFVGCLIMMFSWSHAINTAYDPTAVNESYNWTFINNI